MILIKNILIGITILQLLALPSKAREVLVGEALNVSSNFLLQKNMVILKKIPKWSPLSIENINYFIDKRDGNRMGFIVTLKPKGFIILSNITEIEPVLAYSFNCNWSPDTTRNNILYNVILMDLRVRKNFITKGVNNLSNINEAKWQNLINGNNNEESMFSFRQWPEVGSTSTGGWIETTWYQGTPLNNFCPIDPTTNTRCVTGCGPTAIAQLVNFHKYIGEVNLKTGDRYVTGDKNIKIDADSTNLDFPNFCTLNVLIDSLKYKYKNNMQININDMSTLCFLWGILCKANYSSCGTMTYSMDMPPILLTRMNYYSSILRALDDSLLNDIKENVLNAKPSILSIANGGGHLIVVDGYNTDGFFHLNFGWGSNMPENISDAWYLLPEGMPANYNMIIKSIVDIFPNEFTLSDLSINNYLLDFGPNYINYCSDTSCVTLTNNSNQTIDINYILATNNYYISYDGENYADSLCEILIPPSGKINFYAYFLPSCEHDINGNIIINYKGSKYKCISTYGYGLNQDISLISSGGVDGIWEKSNGPYYIAGDIFINENKRLLIEGGTKIIFIDDFKITVGENAQLVAAGTINDTIYFESFSRWKGIDIINSGSNDTIKYCILKNGYGSYFEEPGGAIYLSNSSPSILNCMFKDNYAGRGGAIYMRSESSPVIINTKFINNKATDGGAMYISSYSSPTISSCQFSYNIAFGGGWGGSIFCGYGCFTKIQNTILDYNKADYGGAISSFTSKIFLLNCTVTNNSSIYFGGGISIAQNSNINIKNSIIYYNNSGFGDNISLGEIDNRPDTIYFDYSNIDTLNPNWVKWVNLNNGVLIWKEGCISKDPLFVVFENVKYCLNENSPCIDAGDPNPIYNDLEDPDNPGFALWPSMGTIRNDIGAYGGGLYPLTVNVEPKSSNNKSPYTFYLFQNYPNPFNPSTKISYKLTRSSFVRLSIYDINGRLVDTLVNEQKNAGSYTVKWNASNLSSGIYIYRIDAGNFSSVKKCLVVK